MPPLYGHTPESGLHLLKDAWTQKQHLHEQALSLASKFDVAVDATFEKASIRTQGFALSRNVTVNISESQEERLLESAMLNRWNQPGLWEISGAWSRLVSFQVPLFKEKEKNSWGYIDLLGVNSLGLPVVVELKKPPRACVDGRTENSESPLRMVLEAAAYAISLRKNWADFRVQWCSRLEELDVSAEVIDRVPDELVEVPLVAAAPACFWLDWLPYTTKGRSKVKWEGFRELLGKFEKAHLPVQFLSISGDYSQPKSLAVQPLDQLPWSVDRG